MVAPIRTLEESLRWSEERFRLLVDSVHDYAIFMLDPNGNVATWNPGAARINGWRADEIIGQHMSVFYPSEDRDKWVHELETATTKGRFEEEGWRVRKDGSRFWANVVVSPLRDGSGHLLGFAKITRDLTERKRIEEERLARVRAEEGLRMRDEFLSIAAHELRTPLAALQLQVQTLALGAHELDPKMQRGIERANRSVERLVGLVDSLLDVSRVATGRIILHKQTLDLGVLVRSVVERHKAAAATAHCPIEVAVTGGIVGRWDRIRVEQIVANLLSNALRYARGNAIHVSVRRDGRFGVVVVADEGPGIPASDISRIFQRFERATSNRQDAGGLGLGLHITRELAEAHGGTVVAENEPHGGARFTVRLPLSER